jgi:hypothetical protein
MNFLVPGAVHKSFGRIFTKNELHQTSKSDAGSKFTARNTAKLLTLVVFSSTILVFVLGGEEHL